MADFDQQPINSNPLVPGRQNIEIQNHQELMG